MVRPHLLELASRATSQVQRHPNGLLRPSTFPTIPMPCKPMMYSANSPVTRIIPGLNASAGSSSSPVSAQNAGSYTVQRTPSNQLPIYELAKAGGNLTLTRIRKITGNKETLAKQLEDTLRPRPAYVKINHLNGHVIVRGHYKSQIEAFLKMQGF